MERFKINNRMSLSDYLVLNPNLLGSEILKIAKRAYKEDKKTVLYFVPDEKLKRKLLRYVSVVTFDELQVAEATKINIDGLASLKNAVLRLYGRGAETIIVKMNNGGVLIFIEERFLLLEAAEDLYTWDSILSEQLKMIMRKINAYVERSVLSLKLN